MLKLHPVSHILQGKQREPNVRWHNTAFSSHSISRVRIEFTTIAYQVGLLMPFQNFFYGLLSCFGAIWSTEKRLHRRGRCVQRVSLRLCIVLSTYLGSLQWWGQHHRLICSGVAETPRATFDVYARVDHQWDGYWLYVTTVTTIYTITM